MNNLEARKHISTLYNLVREFRSEKLNWFNSPALKEACEAIPELNVLESELQDLLVDFNNKLLQFAFDKYPMD